MENKTKKNIPLFEKGNVPFFTEWNIVDVLINTDIKYKLQHGYTQNNIIINEEKLLLIIKLGIKNNDDNILTLYASNSKQAIDDNITSDKDVDDDDDDVTFLNILSSPSHNSIYHQYQFLRSLGFRPKYSDDTKTTFFFHENLKHQLALTIDGDWHAVDTVNSTISMSYTFTEITSVLINGNINSFIKLFGDAFFIAWIVNERYWIYCASHKKNQIKFIGNNIELRIRKNIFGKCEYQLIKRSLYSKPFYKSKNYFDVWNYIRINNL